MSEPQETGKQSKTRFAYVISAIAISCLMIGASLGIMISATTPTIPTVVEPGSMVSDSTYVIFRDDSSYYAKNGSTGAIDYSGTDAVPVIQFAINATSISGGKIHIKTGIYELKSIQVQSTKYYSLGIPSDKSRIVIIEGEGQSVPDWTHVFDTGTVLKVTQAAIDLLPGGYNSYSAIFAMAPWSGFNKPTIILRDLTVRLPTNQISYAAHVFFYGGVQALVEQVTCDHTIVPTALAPGPTNATFGIVLPAGAAAGGLQVARNCWVYGTYIGYDVYDYSELDNCVAMHNTYPFVACWWNSGDGFHAITLLHCLELKCVKGMYLGPGVRSGMMVELLGHDIEFITTTTWAKTGWGNEDPATAGNARGFIRYTTIQSGVGVVYHSFWDFQKGGLIKTVWAETGSELKGINAITGGTSVSFNHYLKATPTYVFCSFNSTAYGSYSWSGNSTQITITVANAGYYNVTWYAEVSGTDWW